MSDMIEKLGRRLMSGDVLELPHLVDEFPLDPNDEIPIALRKFYVISDGVRPAEGYSQTWYPHLWRVKCTPMIDSPEYRDILNQPVSATGGLGVDDGSGNTLRDFISDYNNIIEINDAMLDKAAIDVPLSGFDTKHLFILPVTGGGQGIGDYTVKLTAQGATDAPSSDIKVFNVGYLIGDGIPPNGLPVTSGDVFASNPAAGDFHLKTDSNPQRLFQFNGVSWVKVEDVTRAEMVGSNTTNTLIGGFINNSNTTTMQDGTVVNEKQGLSQALAPQADNVVTPVPSGFSNPFSSEFSTEFE